MTPTYWTEERIKEAFDFIIKEISEECKSLRRTLRDAKEEGEIKLPTMKLFMQWIKDDEELRNQYAQACEVRADSIFDELIEIADQSNKDLIISDKGLVVNYEVIQRSRLMIDTRRWMLGKMAPKKYGDSQRVELDGSLEIKQPSQYILKPANGSIEDEGDTN